MFLSPDPVKTGEMASLAWVFPSKKDWLLLIGLEGDLVVAFISMTMDTISSWFALEDVLFPKASSSEVSSGIRSSAVLYMYVKPGQKAESALCEFAISVLNEHPGIVADFYHGHAWTLKEIKEDLTWNGIHFLRPHKKD
jgi:hypothetical protein